MLSSPRYGLILLAVAFTLVTSSTAWQCAPIQWADSPSWIAGKLRVDNYFFKGCDNLVTRSDFYRCQDVEPEKTCTSDADCAPGQLCEDGTVFRTCVTCSTVPVYSNYANTNVTTNVTASMLAGKFWTIDTFYNHTGVDLILTQENWSWDASGTALAHDFVRHARSTWNDRFDSDEFRTITQRYTIHNASFVKEERAQIVRTSYDNGKGQVYSEQSTKFWSSKINNS